MSFRSTLIQKISFASGLIIVILLMANGCGKSETTQSGSILSGASPQKSSERPDIPGAVPQEDRSNIVTVNDSVAGIDRTKIALPNASDRSVSGEDEIVPEIIRLTFARSVLDRNPVNEVTRVPLSVGKIYTYTVVKSGVQDTIYHVYKYQDHEIARVPILVGVSQTWRTWSTKYLEKNRMGKWDVEIQSRTRVILAKKSFTVVVHLPELLDEPVLSTRNIP